MFLRQYYLGCLAHASYMIADEKTKTAAVVDPQRDIEQYLADAKAAGYTIKYVFLTHFHADFLAGHIELRNQAGARICLGERAGAEFDHTALKDGDVIEFGDVRIQTMETPGHTPEGISLLVFDLAASDIVPNAVLTGDTLFIGDVGRPDLLASIGVTADELAEMLYHSLDKLRRLPDATLVYPAHGAGSLCGKALSKETVSTIGEQKKFNYALQPMPFEQFRDLVTSEQPEAPGYFVYDAIKNRQERPDLESTMQTSLKALSLEEVIKLRDSGAQLVDVREAADFEGAYLAGSINIGLKGKYATWAGSILSHDAPIVVIGEGDNEEEAVMRLGRIGFDNAAGYLKDGMEALNNHPELIRRVSRITAAALSEQLASKEKPFVLDVRSEKEYGIVHLAESCNIPLTHVRERISEVPADRSVVVHCEGGYRSAIACSLLTQAGRTNVSDMVGGIKAWIATKLPTVPESTMTCGTKVCETVPA
ncbi:MAG: MBL fold metallo-hydrolase [Planctomycetaceae bacterium]|nr:MBL fold metallo-hydrolase [Planctomycetaceae bacterium]